MDDQGHVFLLHYIFLPRINKVIESFILGWNSHPLRTEKNWNPTKIWTHGMIDQRNSNVMQVAELQNISDIALDDLEWYGMDWGAPSPNNNGLNTVDLEEIDCPFDIDTIELMHTVNRLQESTSFGIDIFLHASHLLELA